MFVTIFLNVNYVGLLLKKRKHSKEKKICIFSHHFETGKDKKKIKAAKCRVYIGIEMNTYTNKMHVYFENF